MKQIKCFFNCLIDEGFPMGVICTAVSVVLCVGAFYTTLDKCMAKWASKPDNTEVVLDTTTDVTNK